MKIQAMKVALWVLWIVALPALAVNWWEWQLVLQRLTSMGWDLRAGVGLAFAFANVGLVTAIGSDRGWFKRELKS